MSVSGDGQSSVSSDGLSDGRGSSTDHKILEGAKGSQEHVVDGMVLGMISGEGLLKECDNITGDDSDVSDDVKWFKESRVNLCGQESMLSTCLEMW